MGVGIGTQLTTEAGREAQSLKDPSHLDAGPKTTSKGRSVRQTAPPRKAKREFNRGRSVVFWELDIRERLEFRVPKEKGARPKRRGHFEQESDRTARNCTIPEVAPCPKCCRTFECELTRESFCPVSWPHSDFIASKKKTFIASFFVSFPFGSEKVGVSSWTASHLRGMLRG